MRAPYQTLPSMEVPAELLLDVNSYDVEAAKSVSEVVNIFRQAPYHDQGRQTMTPQLLSFLDKACDALSPHSRAHLSDSLLIYGNVNRHNDTGYFGNGRPQVFFHVVLKGTGVLRFPGLRDKSKRELALKPGMVFWMNPRIHHEVTDAEDYGIASLCASVVLTR